MFWVCLFCFYQRLLRLHQSCILYGARTHYVHLSQDQDTCQRPDDAKGTSPCYEISVPVRNTSAGICFSSIHLSTHAGCESWYAGRSEASNEELGNSSPSAFCVKICTWVDSSPTDTVWEVTAAAQSVCYVEVTTVRLHCCWRSGKKTRRVKMKGR